MLTWNQVRAEYARRFAEAQAREGATQESVAQRGGLKNQNAISKLLTNTKRGPSVDTFLKAVGGLGFTLTTFLATLEESAASPSPHEEHEPLPRGNRSVCNGSSSSQTGSVVISTRIDRVDTPPIDSAQYAAIVRTTVEAVLQDLRYRGQPMAAPADADATTHRQPTTRRRPRRRRVRKTA